MPIDMPTVINYVYYLLDEVADSSIAALYTTASGSTTIDPATGVTRAWNDVKNLACRSYFDVRGMFALAYASGVYAHMYADFAAGSGPITADPNIPTPAGSVPWWAYRGFWTPTSGTATRLIWATEPIVARAFPDYQNPANANSLGVPGNFYRLGTQGVGLWAIPNATGTCTIEAFRIPEDATPTTNSIPWISANEWEMLALETAIKIIFKASNDASKQQMLPARLQERDMLVMNKWLSIPEEYRKVRSDGVIVPFSTPPVMMSGGSGGAGK